LTEINFGEKDRENRVLAERMVRTQIEARGITDPRILKAMRQVPRRYFVSGTSDAYGDRPIPIGYGQTISQPYMVAIMTEELSLAGTERVLEIGTGSGYQTAILAELAAEVFTIERIPALLKRAKRLLTDRQYANIEFHLADGSLGWGEKAPFDRILVTAAVASVPRSLKMQLTDNGIIVIPIGDYKTYQVLTIITRVGTHFRRRESIGCRFVPLIGREAY
jgi:protein-L-isoaspartate(D-aspartate) O-methyltransferase